MMQLAIASLLAAGVAAYFIGFAFIAPRDSFLRTKSGIGLLVAVGGSVLILPPQLTAMDSLTSSGGLAQAATSMSLTWPANVSKGGYIAVWALVSVAAGLAGARIWNAGQPGWRDDNSRAHDSSSAARAGSMLTLADTLPDAIDVLARVGLTDRDVDRAADAIRETGRRLTNALPPSDGALYTMVAGRLPAAVAGKVTGYLLEGAGRRGPGRTPPAV